MLTTKDIPSVLGEDSWNGYTKNRIPFTQWRATEDFFSLWREHKDEIKESGFSLYKSKHKGWIVTLFGAHQGRYTSYKEVHKNEVSSELLDAVRDYYESCIRQGYGYKESIKSFLTENGPGLDKAEVRKAFQEVNAELR